MRSCPIGINISEGEVYDDNKGTKEHEASNSKRGAMWRNDGSLEIEEISQDATLETTNVQTGPKRD